MLLFLLACGNISNDLFTEDAAYLDAFPSEERQTVAVDPTTDKAGLGERPELLTLSSGVASDCNSFIYQILYVVDAVRALPPTSRSPNGRAWGPYTTEEGYLASAWMNRDGSVFNWGFIASVGGDEYPFLDGTHYAGLTVADGDGQFTWDQGVYATLVGGTSAGVFTVDYDNRVGVDLLVDIAGYTDGAAAPIDARYAYRADESGIDFQYRTEDDLDWDQTAELGEVVVRTRHGDSGGRADAVITSPDYEGTPVEWTQCWDVSGGLTYQWDSVGASEPVGDESACAWAWAEVDRL